MTEHFSQADRDQLLRQVAALAAFGGHALRTADLDDVLQEATVRVGEGLGTEFAKVLELLPDGGGLRVRAGVGWAPGVVGTAVLGTGRNSAPGYTLETGEPTSSEDVANEPRFHASDLLLAHGVKSVVNVIIRGAEDPPFGVLEVDSRERRRFTQDDVNFLQSYANLLAAAIDRHRAHQELAVALAEKAKAAEEKEALLRELQHRVKNNLQVIISLIAIQGRRAANPEAARELEVIGSRVEAMRLVHERLHGSGDVDRVDLGSYLGELCTNLIGFHAEKAAGIRLDTRLVPMVVGADAAVTLGLIANEFITNSVRHAFPEGVGTITVALEPEGRKARLMLADDGVGLPAQPAARRGSGLQLIRRLGSQIGATLDWQRDGGTRMTLVFPV